MFGLSSPALVQAIEALDRSRVCKECWDSRPQGQIPHAASQYSEDGGKLHTMSEERNGPGAGLLKNQPLPVVDDAVFEKANLEELNSSYSPATDRTLIARLPSQ